MKPKRDLVTANSPASGYNPESDQLPEPGESTPMNLRISILLLAILMPLPLLAGQSAEEAAIDKIHQSLGKLLDTLKREDISPTPIAGLYEVRLGPRIIYVSADGRYLVQGKITDLETGENLTEAKVSAARKQAVDAVGEEKMIIFGPKDARHTITVFTDIDCGYCRKLHSQIDDYNDEGIRIRYLFYPRAGEGSESWRKAEAVWCSDDRKKSLTEAKQGKKIPWRKCDNPVQHDYELGQLVGVTGTPALVLENGELVPGYIPPQRLRRLLDEKFPANKN